MKIFTLGFMILPMLFTAFSLAGEETTVQPPFAPAMPGMPPFGNPEAFRQIIDRLQTEYPEEFAEIVALRHTNPREAMRRGIDLANRAGIELPQFGPPQAVSDGFRQAEAESESAGAAHPSRRDFRRRNMAKAEEAIKREFPEEYARLEELRKTDPEEARHLFRELASRIPGLIISGPLPPPPAEVSTPGDVSTSGAFPQPPAFPAEGEGFPGGRRHGGSRPSAFPPPMQSSAE